MMKTMQKGPNSVGYKKPPQPTQFKPGQSGNPKGRPKKTANLTEIIAKELRRRVQIVINGKRQKVSMLKAIVKQHLTKAAGGEPKSVAILYGILTAIQPESGNKLSELVQEFRAVHERYATLEPDRDRRKHEQQQAEEGTDPSTGPSAKGV